ncbi:uncharacterized protein LOC106408865 [Brassica napus]|uniref:uncharacterized protein LOC106408865 n=1 Tax=Brassica napus TaxID=3708 RepID=UPI0006AAEF05|nr:uncharacterized protein LOC106408865 [Brassica napus]
MYAIVNKFKYKSGKSDPSMMVLKCCGNLCPWRLYAVRLKDSELFEIRSIINNHTCSVNVRGGYQTQATASVIGELMKTKYCGIGAGPKPREIRKMMRGDHDVSISYWKAWKSHDLAIDNCQGKCTDSYMQLPAYLHNLVLANPGTIADLHTERSQDGENLFKYMFLALGASIKGYEALRKVIVVDGTHLKGKYAGCLLTASAQDGNYQIFPLAFAIVDSENDVSWEWFFQHLASFVPDDPQLVIVSDRHPSIYKGMNEVM